MKNTLHTYWPLLQSPVRTLVLNSLQTRPKGKKRELHLQQMTSKENWDHTFLQFETKVEIMWKKSTFQGSSGNSKDRIKSKTKSQNIHDWSAKFENKVKLWIIKPKPQKVKQELNGFVHKHVLMYFLKPNLFCKLSKKTSLEDDSPAYSLDEERMLGVKRVFSKWPSPTWLEHNGFEQRWWHENVPVF